MQKRLVSFLLVVLMVFSMTSLAFADSADVIKGNLVIVGGALESSNAAIYEKFIELAGGKENAKIGIIGAASGKPVHYSNQFKDDLIKYGVLESNIEIVPIAVKNDKTTADIDESTWAENANKKEIVDMIEKYTGIWFVGGDQTRITQVLLKEDGTNTQALDAIWKIYKNGAVIGGTSAGAAIMSDTMIAGGNSLGALTNGFTNTYEDENDQENGPAYITKGLGFFKYGVVDQHFDRKARLGRLAVVVANNKDKSAFGYGVDENTAMVVYNEKNEIEAVGRGGVTILNATNVKVNDKSSIANMQDLLISYIECEDRYSYAKGEYTINPAKDITNGYEYYEISDIINTGVFSANSLVKNFITYDLVDNYGANEVTSYCFGKDGKGVEMIFRKNADTKGYWAYMDGIVDHYSAINVSLDLKPITVSIQYGDKKASNTEYTVKKGDLFWKIAKDAGITIDELKNMNKGINPNLILPGQKLIISK